MPCVVLFFGHIGTVRDESRMDFHTSAASELVGLVYGRVGTAAAAAAAAAAAPTKYSGV